MPVGNWLVFYSFLEIQFAYERPLCANSGRSWKCLALPSRHFGLGTAASGAAAAIRGNPIAVGGSRERGVVAAIRRKSANGELGDRFQVDRLCGAAPPVNHLSRCGRKRRIGAPTATAGQELRSLRSSSTPALDSAITLRKNGAFIRALRHVHVCPDEGPRRPRRSQVGGSIAAGEALTTSSSAEPFFASQIWKL